MRVGFSTMVWLSSYLHKRRLAEVGKGTPGIIRYPREMLIDACGRELYASLNRPPLINRLGDQAKVEDRIANHLSGFIIMANSLKDDPDFIQEVVLQALAYYDEETRRHTILVATLAAELAEELGLSRELLFTAGVIHDFGKMAFPLAMWNDENVWGEREKGIKPLHLQIALATFGQINGFTTAVRQAVRYNHYYDGYPNGVKTDPQIPLTGQILSAADYFDALVNPRPSRQGQALTVEEAWGKIEERRTWEDVGTPYDQRIITTLRKISLSLRDRA